MTRSLAAGAASLVAVTLLVATPSARAAEGDPVTPCSGVARPQDVTQDPPTDPGAPLAALQITTAQDLVRRLSGKEPGAGVRIAVVDSGVDPRAAGVKGSYATPPTYGKSPELAYYHGTAMAGIIAGGEAPGVGVVGIAPAATVYDARVYDSLTNGDESVALGVDGVVAGLTDVARLAGPGPDDIRIVNVSLTVENQNDELAAAIAAITGKGAIVVASSGNRATDGDSDPRDYRPGEDVGDLYFPAGYATSNPLVVAAGTTTDAAEAGDQADPPGLLSSAIDVVVPTYGAVSFGINGATCGVGPSSTSVAAAEVSGILALLMTAFPDETPQQIVSRLEATATGGARSPGGIPDKYLGRGVVQPLEALTRQLTFDAEGNAVEATVPVERAVPAALPREQPDVLAGTRKNAVWWGLFGSGALVVALLLRPVLSRRRGRP